MKGNTVRSQPPDGLILNNLGVKYFYDLRGETEGGQIMRYDLIPYPISIVFLGVFWFAVMLVLWKLRTKGKFYFSLYVAGIVTTLLLAILLGYLLGAGMSN
jgi:hypothetical protein